MIVTVIPLVAQITLIKSHSKSFELVFSPDRPFEKKILNKEL